MKFYFAGHIVSSWKSKLRYDSIHNKHTNMFEIELQGVSYSITLVFTYFFLHLSKSHQNAGQRLRTVVTAATAGCFSFQSVNVCEPSIKIYFYIYCVVIPFAFEGRQDGFFHIDFNGI